MHIASGDLWAGAEVQLYTLAKSLNQQTDTRVSIVLMNHGMLEQKLREEGIDVIVLDESHLNGLKILQQLTRISRELKPDIIHTHRQKENILGSIAAFVNRIPSLRTSHGAPEHKPAWHKLPKHAIQFIDRLCGRFLQKKVIAVSGDLAIILRHNFPAEQIQVIENGIDIASLQTIKSKHSEHQKKPDTIKVGIAGRLVPVKRVDLFIQAAAEVLTSCPKPAVSFHIYGDGPLHTELLALARKLNLEDSLHFEGHCDTMQQALAELDILLITSDHEGLPMVLLEAMTLETTVIAHAVGGIPAVLNQGKYGILVTHHSPHAYANAIHQLIRQPEKRHQLVDMAKTRVINTYSSTKNAAHYQRLYNTLV